MSRSQIFPTAPSVESVPAQSPRSGTGSATGESAPLPSGEQLVADVIEQRITNHREWVERCGGRIFEREESLLKTATLQGFLEQLADEVPSVREFLIRKLAEARKRKEAA